jgi:hypothetical protein
MELPNGAEGCGMKYYCKKCGTKLEFEGGYLEDTDYCYICGSAYELKPIPDWETPADYEKRTGKPFNDNGLVWVKYGKDFWEVAHYGAYKNADCFWKVVIADPPVPPPYDWRPE